MLWAHKRDHAGVDYTYATSTQVAWIVGGRNLAKKNKMLCVRCRFLRKQLEGQKMSLMADITVWCPPFIYVGINLAGPFEVKREKAGMATRRTPGLMKLGAVLYVCLSTQWVKVLLARGYFIEDFLLNLGKFVADQG